MYEIKFSGRYKKDLKRIKSKKSLIAALEDVIDLLSKNDDLLPEKYNDHPLHGKYKEYRECHVKSDWLLVYKKNKKELILFLMATGNHSEIF